MEEQKLIESRAGKNLFLLAASVMFIIYFITAVLAMMNGYSFIEAFFTFLNPSLPIRHADAMLYITLLTSLLFIVLLIMGLVSKSNRLVITNKRVNGEALFRKRVELPLDSVSAVGSCWPSGISIATSSGKITFLMIKNRDEIHKCISDLLIERQNKSTVTTTIKQEAPKSDADELKKYKELLDSGIITQEEFDAKKKQLLGL